MSKTRTSKVRASALQVRNSLISRYRDKYFNLFVNSYEWEGLSPAQVRYIMMRFWYDGKVAGFSPLHDIQPTSDLLAGALDMADGLVFAPFVPHQYNIYDEVSTLELINKRGSPIIPNRVLMVGKDVAIGYAQNSKMPIAVDANRYLDRIVEAEMTIWVNLLRQKLPMIGKISEGNTEKVSDILSKVLNDEPAFLTDLDIGGSLQSVPDSPYIIDKLYNYKCDLENELRTFLGIDNMGERQKKERMITDEADSNDALINDHADIFLHNFSAFADSLNELFGTQISVRAIASPKEADKDYSDEEDNEMEDKEDGDL